MKKIIYLLVFLPFLACQGFLDEVHQDQLIPEKTDHYAALLLEEFNSEYPIFLSIHHMGDNVVEDPTAQASLKLGLKTTYTWQREIEIDEEGTTLSSVNRSWEMMYEDIVIANYVIELVDKAIGKQEDINQIKGEAHFIRAFSYFNLINLYGVPYLPASAETDLGVPLNKDIGVEVSYTRNTLAECYVTIEKDLIEARRLIELSGLDKSIWHPSVLACDLLMSRVKLYQHKWEECIEYADKVIEKKQLSKMKSNQQFVTASNSEILYSFYTLNRAFRTYDSHGSLGDYVYLANKELVDLYDDKDLRKDVFFDEVKDGVYLPLKYESSYTALGFANMRVAEAYLNRAEAYAHLGETEHAIADIKDLHNSRYTDASNVTYPSEPNDVLDFVLEERRKELCFEDHHRWFDLRRMSNRPEIKHIFTLIDNAGVKVGTEIYTLLPNDLNYTLPIPLKERNNNSLIRNNERYEKIPEISNEIIIP